MPVGQLSNPRRLARGRSSRAWPLVLCAVLLVAGCSATSASLETAEPDGSPTTTTTPQREVIVIDGQPVRAMFIPDEEQGPVYAMTDQTLYHRLSGRWEPTRAENDGRAILIDPTNPERLFRGDHPTCGLDGAQPEIPFEVSHDGGMSWRVQPQGRDIQPFLIDPSIPDTLYGSSCFLAISTTTGNTWMRLALMEDFPLTDIAFAGEQLLILGTSLDGVSRLRKVDVTDPAKPLLGELLLEIPGHASLDTRGERIVVGGVETVYVSDDLGTTWTDSRIGLETVTSSVAPEPGRPSGEGADEIGVHVVRLGIGDKRRIYAGTSHGLYISQDGGATWVRYDEIALNAVVTDIQFAIGGADLYVTTDAGVVTVPNP
ncbi:MAG: hypothetical protein ACRD1H_07610 [Vicinamibacterales bacterium]